MTLLHEIQNTAIDPAISAQVLLRKCKVLAARLKYEPFKTWVDLELNGYADDQEVPQYRIAESAQSYGSFIGHVLAPKLHIRPSDIPEQRLEEYTVVKMRKGVAYYQDLINLDDQKKSKQDGDSHNSEFRIPWEAEAIAFVGTRVYRNLTCIDAWIQVSRGDLVSLLDTVTNRVLDFVLELDEIAPDVGEVQSGLQPIPIEALDLMFVTLIKKE